MKLHYQRQGQGKPLIILHGLFGSLENWGAQSKVLAEHYDVIAVDLRNHGRSPHADDTRYTSMSRDILELTEDLELKQVLLMGHSMGGKVAMQFALEHPGHVEKLVVVDIAPVEYTPRHDAVIAGLNAIPLDSLKSRSEADTILSGHVEDAPTRAFLLKNLYRNEHKTFAWRMNLSALARGYADIGAAPEVVTEPYSGPVLFIKGGDSDYLLPQHQKPIQARFPNAGFKIIAGAGHLPHVEKPVAFTRLVEQFLKPAD